ncbi:MAG: hypothetical protein U0Q07_17410 [Acidimicrobiales bacterium]
MRAPRPHRLGAVAGVVVGAVVVAALVATGVLSIPRRDEGDPRAAFLAAYERSRTGTFVVESDFERRMDSGAVLSSAQLVAQRPPDRVVRQFGGIDGIVDGRSVLCTTSPDGGFACSAAGGARDYQAELRQELDNLRGYVTPPAPIYRVERADAGCFELHQVIVYADPPFGSFARFCFDERTGALIGVERRLDNATETLAATSVRSEVTTDDLGLDARDEFAVHTVAPPGSAPGTSPPDDEAAPGTAVPGTTGVPGTAPTAPTTEAPPPPTPPTRPTTSSPPGTVLGGEEALGQLRLLTNATLIERGSAAPDPGPYRDEALRRIREFTLSINDPVWLDDGGRPRALWAPVVQALLGG